MQHPHKGNLGSKVSFGDRLHYKCSHDEVNEGDCEGSLQLLTCDNGAHSIDLRLQICGMGVNYKKVRGKKKEGSKKGRERAWEGDEGKEEQGGRGKK